MKSPYDEHNIQEWDAITNEIIEKYPISEDDIVDSVKEAWYKTKQTKIGGELQIGIDVFPEPQVMGQFLHELIPVTLASKFPSYFRKGKIKSEKDVVYTLDDELSIEIKTSSDNTNLYGNRSYGQKNSQNNSGKKKEGYYIGVNFEKYTDENHDPQIKKIRFGWIDHEDWVPQKKETGQQAKLTKEARDHKLKLIYEYKKPRKRKNKLK